MSLFAEWEWLFAPGAKQDFEKVYGKPVESWLNSNESLGLTHRICKTEEKQKALARVLATNVNIDGWNVYL